MEISDELRAYIEKMPGRLCLFALDDALWLLERAVPQEGEKDRLRQLRKIAADFMTDEAREALRED